MVSDDNIITGNENFLNKFLQARILLNDEYINIDNNPLQFAMVVIDTIITNDLWFDNNLSDVRELGEKVKKETWKKAASYISAFLAMCYCGEFIELQYFKICDKVKNFFLYKGAYMLNGEELKHIFTKNAMDCQNNSLMEATANRYEMEIKYSITRGVLLGGVGFRSPKNRMPYNHLLNRLKKSAKEIKASIELFKSAIKARRQWAKQKGCVCMIPNTHESYTTQIREYLENCKTIIKNSGEYSKFQMGCFNYDKIPSKTQWVFDMYQKQLDMYYTNFLNKLINNDREKK